MKFKDVLQKLGIENRYNTFFPEYNGYLRLYDTMLNFVENLLENERGPMNGQDLTKTDYDPDRSLVLSSVSLIF
jgi:hypothetical protein